MGSPSPVTIICMTEPSVVQQGGKWIVVLTPDSQTSKQSAEASIKIAAACSDAPSGTDLRKEACTHVGTSKMDDVPSWVHDLPELTIDDDNGAVRWSSNAIKLGDKSRRFIELLYQQGVGEVVEVQEIEQVVFRLDENDPDKLFVPINTIKQFVKRLKRSLTTVQFPYNIEPVKALTETNSALQITGFRLVLRHVPRVGT